MQRQNDFVDKEDAYSIAQSRLIDALLNTGGISGQFANLLRSFQASTTAPAEATLKKVQAVMALRETLNNKGVAQKRTAYIGSRFDWHLPVALGARDIVMLDLVFQNPAFRQQLLGSVKQYGAEIKTFGTDNSLIEFVLDLGQGLENVTLRVEGADAHEYIPQQPLGFVLQFYGPWEKTNRLPVFENIARGMANSGLVFNFEYPHSRYTPDAGMEFIERERFYLYQVADAGKMMAVFAEGVRSDPAPEAYLKISREIEEARRKKQE